MGHGKISLKDKIKERRARSGAFYKRKFGALRKLVQLSKMCDKDVLLYIHDQESNTVIEYASNPNFDLKYVQSKLDPQDFSVSLTRYTNDDYELMTMRHLPKDHWD